MSGNDGYAALKHIHALDVSQKLVVKLDLNGDIRRLPLDKDDITLKELSELCASVFKGSLKPSDKTLFKYFDEDGDLITIVNDADLEYATIHSSKVLKIVIYVNPDTNKCTNASPHLQAVILEGLNELNKKMEFLSRTVSNALPGKDNEVGAPTAPVDPDVSKNFDPLSDKNSTASEEKPKTPEIAVPRDDTARPSSYEQQSGSESVAQTERLQYGNVQTQPQATGAQVPQKAGAQMPQQIGMQMPQNTGSQIPQQAAAQMPQVQSGRQVPQQMGPQAQIQTNFSTQQSGSAAQYQPQYGNNPQQIYGQQQQQQTAPQQTPPSQIQQQQTYYNNPGQAQYHPNAYAQQSSGQQQQNTQQQRYY
eukprot:Nk52_evm51s215 gene=Nk52_evmTU51s215